MPLLNISDATFRKEVLDSELPVLVDFWALGCGPCKMLNPALEELAVEYSQRLKIVKLNIEDNSKTPADYGVMSIPTIIFFKNGRVSVQTTGILTKAGLKKRIEDLLR
jgi:thioredoxin 1